MNLKTNRDFILGVLTKEEESFRQTLKNGINLLENEFTAIKSSKKTATLSGKSAFVLHDTYGFPLELTQEIAGERSIASVLKSGARPATWVCCASICRSNTAAEAAIFVTKRCSTKNSRAARCRASGRACTACVRTTSSITAPRRRSSAGCRGSPRVS
ncbi:MAG: hypothetical protein EBR15_01720 [Gammaproteobacteria bacterium]|nr:hypothetical protein [Gammaproteobacteria bacterium]